MRRTLFFWLEKLKITPHERIAVASLLILLLLLSSLNMILEPFAAVDTAYYEEINQEFDRRTALLDRRRARLMKRYDPPEMLPVDSLAVADMDTLPIQDDDGVAAESVADTQRVDINTGTLEELKTLPGIGPAYGQRIIDYRIGNGPFQSVDELINIKGIGEKRLEKLKPFVKI